MASELKVNKITPESGVTLTLGDSGDTINFGSGVLPNFENLTVTGDLTVDTNSLKVDSTNNFVGIGTASPTVALDVVGAITATGNITGTLATAAQPNITSLGTLTGLTTTGDINFGDNDKAVFGAGSDLQIYHDGSSSYVEDAGTGSLFLRGNPVVVLGKYTGERFLDGTADGAVQVYYDNAIKLATTSTGVDVTGTVVSDGLTVDTAADNGATISAHDNLTTTYPLKVQNAAGSGRLEIGTYGINNNIDLKFQTQDTLRMRIDDSLGDVMFYEDTGTTPKFFWDASAERLGLGTSSPSTALDVSGTVTANAFSGDGSSLTNISTDLVNDTTPQLGGDLDGNGNTIDLSANTTELRLPRGTTAQQPTPSAANEGAIRYDTDDELVYYSDGNIWLKIAAEIPTLTSVTGDLIVGVASTLTLSGTNFLTANLVVNFVQSSDAIDEDVTVTPSSSTSATVNVPAAVYNNVTGGNVVTIKVTNSDNASSNAVNKTAVSLPSGGTISTSGSFRIHTFNSSGTFTNTISNLSVEYLVIAGGGGGGADAGGGGGAGGYRTNVSGESSGGNSSPESSMSLSATSYSVIVGAGGSAVGTTSASGNQGSSSSFNGISSVGGGGGKSRSSGTSNSAGGSGGGGSGHTPSENLRGTGTSGQGFNGGNGSTGSAQPAGGGGGAGGSGGNATSSVAGNGGSGITSSITGSSVTRGGGGGGGAHQQTNGTGGSGGGGNGGFVNGSPPRTSGAANTGGGGGGQDSEPPNATNGSGGSGVVIIRYQL